MESERLEVEREIAIAEAKTKVYNLHAETDLKETSSPCNVQAAQNSSVVLNEYLNQFLNKKNKVKSGDSNAILTVKPTGSSSGTADVAPPTATNTIQPNQNTDSLSHLNDLCNFLKIQSAPDVDMDYFSGNPLDFGQPY